MDIQSQLGQPNPIYDPIHFNHCAWCGGVLDVTLKTYSDMQRYVR